MSSTVLTSIPETKELLSTLIQREDRTLDKRGRFDVKNAFAHQPEIAKKVGWDRPQLRGRIYYHLSQIRRDAPKPAGPNGGPVTATAERNRLLEDAFANGRFMARDGTIDWPGLFTARPELRVKLGWDNPLTKSRVYAAASAIRKRLGRTPPKRDRTTHRQQALDLLLPLKNSLPRDNKGRVLWNLFFMQQPEMKSKLLSLTNDTTRQFLYKLSKHLDATTAVSFALAPVAAASAPQPAPPPPAIHFCPGCGLNLQMFNTAFAIAHKHSHK